MHVSVAISQKNSPQHRGLVGLARRALSQALNALLGVKIAGRPDGFAATDVSAALPISPQNSQVPPMQRPSQHSRVSVHGCVVARSDRCSDPWHSGSRGAGSTDRS